MTPADPIAAQQAALGALYRTHVAPGSRYALVDFPDHANVGDSAIWLGELTMLRQVTGHDPCYVSTWHDFDADAFRRACPDGTLFLHGGGNLGDIWVHHQQFREHILSTIRDRPIVQLPQSIHFRDPARADRFAALAGAHPDFVLYARDRRSLEFARQHLACPSQLAPDSAYALGRQARGAPICDLLMLMRTDDERRGYAVPPTSDATVVDWLEDRPGLPPGVDPAAREAQATARVDRGFRLLAQGRVVVTDRLHGHILADLLGIPHVALDNDYGKVAAYLDAWPASSALVRTATTMDQALDLAGRFGRVA
ncbi:polysaccharide pyruvyl transferase family protein [Sphingomonas prati]|uniref:Pyruvyl transferase EpsO n=1 Tax=Sphingomonas prati TaxID=1843237 RepID=A0A7W9BV54_9SPHN|nr:polysaccharide pyruvyl transferase family protein [Sphingomonas prati]MBB5730716.1 pyruvyl transferase EpsO [Sphingomonas prati]GGE95756.1 exopolysaccharide biosynthesis protein [Sphingomonas prati]